MFKEIMAEKFPNMNKDTNINIQEGQQTPSKVNLKRRIPRNIIIKLSKGKHNERILKAAREATSHI